MQSSVCKHEYSSCRPELQRSGPTAQETAPDLATENKLYVKLTHGVIYLDTMSNTASRDNT